MTTSEIKVCPECRNDVLITNLRGQITCNKCGVVLKQKCIDSKAEWRTFNNEQYNNRTRTGPKLKLSMYDKGLTTIIGKGNKDAFGTNLTPIKRSEIKRLRKWHERTKVSKTIDRNLMIAMNILNILSSQLNLTPNTKEEIAYYYRKIAQKRPFKGQSIDTLIKTIIYAILRNGKKFASIQLFNDIISLRYKKISKYLKLIQRELNLNLSPIKPQELIYFYCKELSISGRTETNTIITLDALEKLVNFSGKRPSCVASAVLYYVCLANNERRSQKYISSVADITEGALRQTCRTLRDKIFQCLSYQERNHL
ncbi:MAG: transcription initiation factor IIB family protein [Promethearchaeota archaeon]